MAEQWNDDGKRRYAWFLTENNHDWTMSQSLPNLTLENWRKVRYAKFSEEIGENGTPHVHCYVVLDNACTFSQVKQRFSRANIQPRFGKHHEAKEYIGNEQKSGQILKIWELGNDDNMVQGLRTDITSLESRLCDIKEMIDNGASLDDIYAFDFPTMMRFGREISRYAERRRFKCN